jgi:hypothetical protein
MRRRLLLLSAPVLLLGSAAVLVGQDRHLTAFTGTWKLNVAKSKFVPGPPFKSFTLAFAPDGVRKLDLIFADGQPFKASLPWSDGKQVAVALADGKGNLTAVSRIHGRTVDDTWMDQGQVIEKVHGVVSQGGRILSITVDGTPLQGGAYQNRLVFEKQ